MEKSKDWIRRGRTACWRGPCRVCFHSCENQLWYGFWHLNNLWVAFSFCFIIYSAFYFNSIPAISLLRVVAMCPFSGELLGMFSLTLQYDLPRPGLYIIITSAISLWWIQFCKLERVPSIYFLNAFSLCYQLVWKTLPGSSNPSKRPAIFAHSSL